VGTVFSFDISLVNGYVSLGAYIATAHRGRKHGPEGGALFLDYLFAYYPMRKIYTDIFSYNAHSLHVATRYGFEVEATFKRHRWYRDRYWDVYRVALYRETWDRVRNELAPLMDPGAADA
jgi:RimJ/RimL family protein N-acetyltransferase